MNFFFSQAKTSCEKLRSDSFGESPFGLGFSSFEVSLWLSSLLSLHLFCTLFFRRGLIRHRNLGDGSVPVS